MASVNKVFLIGHVGKDPEIINTAGGNTIAKFSLATSEKYNGEEKTQWHRIVVFGKLTEIVAQYIKKGSQVYLEGKIDYQQWESEGVTKYATDIVVFQMQMLGAKGQTDKPAPAKTPAREYQAPPPSEQDTDDIPF